MSENTSKEINCGRVFAAALYLLVGILLLRHVGFRVFDSASVQWCLGFSALGIAVGLINTRDHKTPSDICFCVNWLLHFLGYYGFVLVIVSLLAFTIAVYKSGESWSDPHVKFYSLSALIGLIGGFLGDMFRPLALKFLKLLEK